MVSPTSDSKLPVDTNVQIPESVRRAAALAESFYQKAPAPTPEPPVPPVAATPPVAPEPPAPPPEPLVPPAPQAAPQEPPQPPAEPPEPLAPPSDAPVAPEQWEHRYLSMKGRYDAQMKINGQMQEQMQQLGDELIRTQQMLLRPAAPQRPQAPPAPISLLTPEDTQNYGNDLIDLTKRAALEAVSPQLTKLEQENQNLRNTLKQTAQMGVAATLDQQVPNWREVNKDPKFRNWLSLRNVYSGVIRKQELDAAYQAADAPRVLAFFKGFIADEAVVTGGNQPAPVPEPPQAPRQAAVPLERLASPGRARPAGGNDTPNVPADKPIFTRKQVSAFYDEVRRGSYAGRDADKAAQERAIFDAQRDGRIR